MKSITAIYENGVFRPLGPVELPEKCEVEVMPKETSDQQKPTENQDAIWDILSRRYGSDHHDTAERHNEHQP